MRVLRSMVAKEAGVTPTTVSCVLNNTRPVSDKVRKKVMDAIEKLNYVPDMTSRAMKGKGAKQIAVMVDSIKNPFLAELVYSLEEAGVKKGFFCNICGKRDLKQYIPNIIARKIDAVYFCSEIKNDEVQYVRQLLNNGIKVLTSSHFTHFSDEISRIDMATGSAITRAVRLLHEKGHTKIGFLNTFRADSGLDDRLSAYLSTMAELGLPPIFVSPEHTILSNVENGKKLFAELIETHTDVTAIIGLNDLVALGAMNEAQRRGFRVPDDLSFIGIDGIELANLVSPKLTTFWSNASGLGHKAFDILYHMIKNGEILSFTHEMIYMEGETVKDLRK